MGVTVAVVGDDVRLLALAAFSVGHKFNYGLF